MFLAQNLRDTALLELYEIHLLETVVSKGDAHESANTHEADVELAAQEIVELLAPLAAATSNRERIPNSDADEEIVRLQREAWFNIIVHGITPFSNTNHQYSSALQSLAKNSEPLVAQDRTDQFESEIELNTILRRGMNAHHTAEQKRRLISLLPRCESDIRTLSYPKVMFLHATYIVEILRAEAGDCINIQSYFLGPIFNGSAVESCLVAISDEVMELFLRYHRKSATVVAEQLAQIFTGCCHRIPRVQQIAASCAEKIMRSTPSSLCQRKPLFALLELLTIMWTSCLDCEIDEYDWKPLYVSERGAVSVELSDDFEMRKNALNSFYKRAKVWVTNIINIAPLDVKSLLQV